VQIRATDGQLNCEAIWFILNSKTILFLSKYDEKYSCSLSLSYYVKQGKIISDKKIRLNKIQKELLKESLFESN
jgi:hypothetical protein